MCTVEDVHGRRWALEDGESRNLEISETVNGDVRADKEGVMRGLPPSNTDSSLQSKEMKQSERSVKKRRDDALKCGCLHSM